MATMKLSEISRIINAEMQGEDVEIKGVSPIEEAQRGHITFLANPRYTSKLRTTKASAVILSSDFGPCHLPTLRASDPYLVFAQILPLFYHPPEPEPGIHPTAVVHPSAQIGQRVSIGAHTYIAHACMINDDVIIYPNCTIYPGVIIGRQSIIHSNCSIREHTVLGQRVIVQNGVCIGGDGFGFAKRPDGRWHKIIQSGRVLIEDEVEIGANTTVDRAAIGVTRIGRGTKIDNLVQIGHASNIGEDSLLCAQVGLAGSTHIGNGVILAGQVGVAGHLTIGDKAVATAQTGIPSSVPAGATVSGYPAIENKRWLRASVLFARLPEMAKQILGLEKRIEHIEHIEKLHLK
jgi:UDP-3-O-[3-hydroxymyristoyl] glucosamine N-acyltransferase